MSSAEPDQRSRSRSCRRSQQQQQQQQPHQQQPPKATPPSVEAAGDVSSSRPATPTGAAAAAPLRREASAGGGGDDFEFECAICLDGLAEGAAEGVRPFTCEHRLHAWCAQELLSKKCGVRCPSCRAGAFNQDCVVESDWEFDRLLGAEGNQGGDGASPADDTESDWEPFEFGNLPAHKRWEMLASAFRRERMEGMTLSLLVEGVNSILVLAGMEVLTKLGLLLQLHSLGSVPSFPSKDTMQLKEPAGATYSIFLDDEARVDLERWRQEKERREREERERQEAQRKREEARMQAHMKELEAKSRALNDRISTSSRHEAREAPKREPEAPVVTYGSRAAFLAALKGR